MTVKDSETGPDSLAHPHARVWALAGPAIIANISGPMLGIVDTWALGHLPHPEYLAGLAVGSILFSFVYWSFGFLRMGTTGVAAQAYGKKDDAKLARIFIRATVLALVIATGALVLKVPLEWGAFALVNAGPAEEALAREYFSIRIYGMPAALINLTVIGWLIGTQRAKTALVVQVFLNVLNAALNLMFVVGLGWTVDGVATGSVIAEYTAAVLGLFIIFRAAGRDHIRAFLTGGELLLMAGYRRLLAINLDLFIRTLFLSLAFLVFVSIGARMGTETLAANHVLFNFFLLTALGLDGFAHAAEALAGAAIGERKPRALRQVVVVSSQWAAGMSVVLAAFFWLAGDALIAGMTDIETVRETAQSYLPWIILLPITGVWCFQLDGIFIGATASRDMVWTMIVSVALYGLMVWAFVGPWGNHGLWLALNLFMIVRAITLAACYPRIERRLALTHT